MRRPPAVSADRVIGGEKDFSGLRGTQAASGLPAHRQVAGDGEFASAQVASRQHGVWCFLREDTVGQFAAVFPGDVFGAARLAGS